MKTAGVVLLTVILMTVFAGTALAQGPVNPPPPPGAPQGWWAYKTVPSTQWDSSYEAWLRSNGWSRYDVDWRTIGGTTTQVFKYRQWRAAPTVTSLGLIPRYSVDRYSGCWNRPNTTYWTPQGCVPASRWY